MRWMIVETRNDQRRIWLLRVSEKKTQIRLLVVCLLKKIDRSSWSNIYSDPFVILSRTTSYPNRSTSFIRCTLVHKKVDHELFRSTCHIAGRLHRVVLPMTRSAGILSPSIYGGN
jgi:hypothetical protein